MVDTAKGLIHGARNVVNTPKRKPDQSMKTGNLSNLKKLGKSRPAEIFRGMRPLFKRVSKFRILLMDRTGFLFGPVTIYQT